MLVPSWARAKAKAIKKTPARLREVPSPRKDWRRSRGFQIASPNMMTEEEETIMPMKEVIAKPMGMVKSWDHRASFGLMANLAKSGSFYKALVNASYQIEEVIRTTMRVAKFAIEDMIPVTIPHANFEPCDVLLCFTIGPMPLARTRAQMKKAIPAVGTTYALTVKR